MRTSIALHKREPAIQQFLVFEKAIQDGSWDYPLSQLVCEFQNYQCIRWLGANKGLAIVLGSIAVGAVFFLTNIIFTLAGLVFMTAGLSLCHQSGKIYESHLQQLKDRPEAPRMQP